MSLWDAILFEYKSRSDKCGKCRIAYKEVASMADLAGREDIEESIIIALLSGITVGRIINIEAIVRYMDRPSRLLNIKPDPSLEGRCLTLIAIRLAVIREVLMKNIVRIYIFKGNNEIKGVTLTELYKYILNRFDNLEEALIQYKRWYKISMQTDVLSRVIKKISKLKLINLTLDIKEDMIYIDINYGATDKQYVYNLLSALVAISDIIGMGCVTNNLMHTQDQTRNKIIDGCEFRYEIKEQLSKIFGINIEHSSDILRIIFDNIKLTRPHDIDSIKNRIVEVYSCCYKGDNNGLYFTTSGMQLKVTNLTFGCSMVKYNDIYKINYNDMIEVGGKIH